MPKIFALAALTAALFIAASEGQARASVIYDLTLTATSDTDGTPLSTYNGTGTITLSSAPSSTGQSSYTSAAVTFFVDGKSFSGTATSVQFLMEISATPHSASKSAVARSVSRWTLRRTMPSTTTMSCKKLPVR